MGADALQRERGEEVEGLKPGNMPDQPFSLTGLLDRKVDDVDASGWIEGSGMASGVGSIVRIEPPAGAGADDGTDRYHREIVQSRMRKNLTMAGIMKDEAQLNEGKGQQAGNQ